MGFDGLRKGEWMEVARAHSGPPSGAGLSCNYTGSPVSQGPQITDLSWSSPLAPGGHAEAAHNVVGECADLGACRLNIKTFCINYIEKEKILIKMFGQGFLMDPD